MAAFPRCPLWDFSLALYTRPGVAPACLALQDRHGLDVNLLLFCLWAARKGPGALAAADMATLVAATSAWQGGVVGPLRTARRRLKRALEGHPASPFAARIRRLREAIKTLELEAEHHEQLVLWARRPKRPPPAKATDPTALGRANLEAYLAALGIRPDAADQAALAAILKALPGPRRPRIKLK
ncbi:MAG: TIGR02444 family protein [Pseudomonadota bacterium]